MATTPTIEPLEENFPDPSSPEGLESAISKKTEKLTQRTKELARQASNEQDFDALEQYATLLESSEALRNKAIAELVRETSALVESQTEHINAALDAADYTSVKQISAAAKQHQKNIIWLNERQKDVKSDETPPDETPEKTIQTSANDVETESATFFASPSGTTALATAETSTDQDEQTFYILKEQGAAIPVKITESVEIIQELHPKFTLEDLTMPQITQLAQISETEADKTTAQLIKDIQPLLDQALTYHYRKNLDDELLSRLRRVRDALTEADKNKKSYTPTQASIMQLVQGLLQAIPHLTNRNLPLIPKGLRYSVISPTSLDKPIYNLLDLKVLLEAQTQMIPQQLEQNAEELAPIGEDLLRFDFELQQKIAASGKTWAEILLGKPEDQADPEEFKKVTNAIKRKKEKKIILASMVGQAHLQQRLTESQVKLFRETYNTYKDDMNLLTSNRQGDNGKNETLSELAAAEYKRTPGDIPCALNEIKARMHDVTPTKRSAKIAQKTITQTSILNTFFEVLAEENPKYLNSSRSIGINQQIGVKALIRYYEASEEERATMRNDLKTKIESAFHQNALWDKGLPTQHAPVLVEFLEIIDSYIPHEDESILLPNQPTIVINTPPEEDNDEDEKDPFFKKYPQGTLETLIPEAKAVFERQETLLQEWATWINNITTDAHLMEERTTQAGLQNIILEAVTTTQNEIRIASERFHEIRADHITILSRPRAVTAEKAKAMKQRLDTFQNEYVKKVENAEIENMDLLDAMTREFIPTSMDIQAATHEINTILCLDKRRANRLFSEQEKRAWNTIQVLNLIVIEELSPEDEQVLFSTSPKKNEDWMKEYWNQSPEERSTFIKKVEQEISENECCTDIFPAILHILDRYDPQQ